MSMRTTLSGCRLSAIRQAIGEADDQLIEAVQKRVDKGVRNYEEDEDEEGVHRLRDLAGVIIAKLRREPAANLEDEGHAGYLAATAVLKHVSRSRRLRTGFEVKSAFWFEVLDRYARELGQDAELFRCLASGRPLFGRRINNECLYAWFDRDEAARLRDAALRIGELWREKAAGRSPPLWLDTEAVRILTDEREGLAGCINSILAAGYDVWAETT